MGTHFLWKSTFLSFDPVTCNLLQHFEEEENEEKGEDAVDAPASPVEFPSEGIVKPVKPAPPSSATSVYSISSELHVTANRSSSIAFLSSVPMFYPSPAGQHCLVHWYLTSFLKQKGALRI